MRINGLGNVSGAAVAAGAGALAAVGAAVATAIAVFGATGNVTTTDTAAVKVASTVIFYDFFVYPSDNITNTCSSTCGTGIQPCCGGGQSTAATTTAGTCGTQYDDCGPSWVLQSGVTSPTIVAGLTPPAGFSTHSNKALHWNDTGDLRGFRTIDTSPSSLACAQGMCDSSHLNTAGNAGLGVNGVPIFIGLLAAGDSADTSSVFFSMHLLQGWISTCGQNKEFEWAQLLTDNLHTTYLFDFTCGTHTCVGGSTEGSKWITATAFDTTAHVAVYKLDPNVAENNTTPDDSSASVTNSAGVHTGMTIRIDQLDESGGASRARVVGARPGGAAGFGWTTLEVGGSLKSKIGWICIAGTYSDAATCPIP